MLFQYETMKNKIYIMLNKVFRYANMFVYVLVMVLIELDATHHMIYTLHFSAFCLHLIWFCDLVCSVLFYTQVKYTINQYSNMSLYSCTLDLLTSSFLSFIFSVFCLLNKTVIIETTPDY